jgi:hypothetical protein
MVGPALGWKNVRIRIRDKSFRIRNTVFGISLFLTFFHVPVSLVAFFNLLNDQQKHQPRTGTGTNLLSMETFVARLKE